MSSKADDFTLEELQEIKSWIEQYGMDLKYFKPVELSSIEVCKDIGHFNVEAWFIRGYPGWTLFQEEAGFQ